MDCSLKYNFTLALPNLIAKRISGLDDFINQYTI
jgi:hypothetical protein